MNKEMPQGIDRSQEQREATAYVEKLTEEINTLDQENDEALKAWERAGGFKKVGFLDSLRFKEQQDRVIEQYPHILRVIIQRDWLQREIEKILNRVPRLSSFDVVMAGSVDRAQDRAQKVAQYEIEHGLYQGLTLAERKYRRTIGDDSPVYQEYLKLCEKPNHEELEAFRKAHPEIDQIYEEKERYNKKEQKYFTSALVALGEIEPEREE